MIVRKARLPIVKMLTVGLLPSCLKIWLYRLMGAKIGPGVRIGVCSVISARETLEIGAGTHIGMFAMIDSARVVIGKRATIRAFVMIDAEQVEIGDDVTISELVLIRTLVPSRNSKIVIHNRAHIFPFSMIDPTREVEIGEESSIGYDTYVFTHGAYKSKLDGYPVEFGEVHIGERVWIPCRVFMMPSVTIGDDAVIGTGALVKHDIPAGVLAVGAPAKAIRSKEQYVVNYSDEEKIQILTHILEEFCQYLHDFAGATWQSARSGTDAVWEVSLKKRNVCSTIELVASCATASPERISVILGAVPGETQAAWDRDGKVWFSVGSHRCSEHLDELGEELREFFRRYGLYYARP